MPLSLYGVDGIEVLSRWAESNGLGQINDDFIDCYKSVITIESFGTLRYFSGFQIFSNPFEWFPDRDEIVECKEIDIDPNNECSCGLYGASLAVAQQFMESLHDVSILKLRVPLDDNIIVVPYGRFGNYSLSNKFRFKKCQVIGKDIGKTRLTAYDKARILNATASDPLADFFRERTSVKL